MLFAVCFICILCTYNFFLMHGLKEEGRTERKKNSIIVWGWKAKNKKNTNKFQFSVLSWSQFMCRGVFPIQILRYNTFSARDYLYSFSKYLRGGKRGTEKEREEQGVAMGLGNDRWGMWFTAEELKKTGNCRL